MNESKKKYNTRNRKRLRIRKKVYGTIDRPRMSIFISNRYIYIQFIDDEASRTIISCSTLSSEFKVEYDKLNIDNANKNFNNVKSAEIIANILSKKLKESSIKKAVLDRGRYMFHGIIKKIVDIIHNYGLSI